MYTLQHMGNRYESERNVGTEMLVRWSADEHTAQHWSPVETGVLKVQDIMYRNFCAVGQSYTKGKLCKHEFCGWRWIIVPWLCTGSSFNIIDRQDCRHLCISLLICYANWTVVNHYASVGWSCDKVHTMENIWKSVEHIPLSAIHFIQPSILWHIDPLLNGDSKHRLLLGNTRSS
jgi:hypothetical protein